jgi:hypothetical protein
MTTQGTSFADCFDRSDVAVGKSLSKAGCESHSFTDANH